MLIGRKHITPVFVAESSDDFSIWILEKHQWTNNSWSRSLKATDNEYFEGSVHMSSFKLILRGDIYQVRLMAFNNFRSVNDESVKIGQSFDVLVKNAHFLDYCFDLKKSRTSASFYKT